MLKYYYLEIDSNEIICGGSKGIAKMMLCKSLYHNPEEHDLLEYNDHVYDDLNNYNMSSNNIMIGVSADCDLYIENWNISDDNDDYHDSIGRVFLDISKDDRSRINQLIHRGENLIKDGCRTKTVSDGLRIKYTEGLTFWWDSSIDKFWACLPTDEEAVMWMLNQ